MNLVVKLGYGIMCFCEYDFLDVDYNIVEVMILSINHVSPCCFQTSFRETARLF